MKKAVSLLSLVFLSYSAIGEGNVYRISSVSGSLPDIDSSLVIDNPESGYEEVDTAVSVNL